MSNESRILHDFCKRLVALDMDIFGLKKKPAQDEDKWITVKPNGAGNTGRPVLIDGETGKVKGGMGGKFNGKKISQAKSASSKPEDKGKSANGEMKSIIDMHNKVKKLEDKQKKAIEEGKHTTAYKLQSEITNANKELMDAVNGSSDDVKKQFRQLEKNARNSVSTEGPQPSQPDFSEQAIAERVKKNFRYNAEKKRWDYVGPSSPNDEQLAKFKSWEEVRDNLEKANGKIVFGAASERDRKMNNYPETQADYNDVVRKGPAIAKDYEDMSRLAGGMMYGKEFGVKGTDSLERKIKGKLDDGSRDNPSEALNRMTDVVRFTTLANDKEIPQVATKLIDGMKKKGYTLVEVENKWNDPSKAYNGLHFLFRKDGVTFEAQIHSPNGMIIKNKLHHYYNIERDPKNPPAEREDARLKQIEIAKGYVRPQGIEKFTDWNISKGGEYHVQG